MRIAELAGKRSVVVAAVVTAGLVASTWPRHHHHHHAHRLAPIGRCADYVAPNPTPKPAPIVAHHATIETSMGVLRCALLPDAAPITVDNFATLSRRGFYDGLIFHRVIPGFVIQGGDPSGNGTGGPGYELADEVGADLPIRPGVLAMANKGPNTSGSQFFITDGSPDHLRGHYTIFGQCDNAKLVHAIASVPRDFADKPTTAVTMT